MGSSAQRYNLGWSEFDLSLKSAVKDLRLRGDLVDVTLAAGGKTFPAHKLVLSAASTLFLELLRVTPCKHPVILLAGVDSNALESLLEFVYSGEVSVHPSQLSSLLQAAHILNIRGLSQGSITAEKPEDQNVAEAAMASSSIALQKLNLSSLAPATRTDLIAAGSRPKRKCKWKDSDSSDVPHNKWGNYDDSGDESSESESMIKEFHGKTTSNQTGATSASVNKAILSVVESGLKAHKQATTLMPLNPAAATTSSMKSSMPKTEPVAHQSSISSDETRTMSLDERESNLIPPHHLDLHEDEENKGDYEAIAAAADAAALAASTLADKKGISEQPAACPLCNAIIRQSRNLRRHLELKHFGKRPKKGKTSKRKVCLNQCDTDTESNAGSVADTTVIEHVQVEMKSPSVCEAVLSSVPPSASSSPTQTPTLKHHTLTELQPAHQHQNVETYLQQQQHLQQLQIEPFHHMAPPSSNSTYQIPYPHPHRHLSMMRGDPHASLLAADSIAFRTAAQQQFSSVYSESTRSASQQ